MKKTLLTLTIILLTMATAMAGSDLTVKRGNKKFIKEAKGVAALEFNFEGATFDDKMPLTDKYPDIALLQNWHGMGSLKSSTTAARICRWCPTLTRLITKFR